MKLMHPQEIEVFYVLPSIRRELTLSLKENGMGQKQIAKLLGVTEAAISNYVRNKRAKDIQFSNSFKLKIKESSKRITDDLSLFREIQQLLVQSRLEGAMCKACHEFSERDIPKGCRTCIDEVSIEEPNVRLPNL